MLRDFLKQVVHGGTLSREDAAKSCELLFQADSSPLEIGALLSALHARGETVDELSGFLDTMRAHMIRVRSTDKLTVDLCGTGGDGSHSFNLSTAAALLAAACGVTVAKHGNRAVSSKSGSADFLDALNIPFCATAVEAELSLAQYNFAFLFAPHFHSAMKSVASVRKELEVRTIFNLLGPLANPARVRRQLIGVFDPKWMQPLVETLAQSGSEFVIAVHGAGGLDEIALDGDTHYCMLRDGNISEGVWRASGWSASPVDRTAIAGSDDQHNAKRLLAVADGQELELRDWIVANCAPALMLAERVGCFEAAVFSARECVSSGAFKAYLNSLRTT